MPSFLQKITRKPLRFWLLWAGILFALFYSIYLIFTYRLAVINSTDNLGETSLTAYSEDFNQKPYTPARLSNLVLLKHDTLAIEAKKEEKGTLKKIGSIPPFSIPTITLSLQPTQGISKHGYDSKECLLYDQANKTPVSYKCNNTTTLYRYKPSANIIGTDANETTDILNTGSIRPFRNGYIGIMKAQTDNLPEKVLEETRFIYYRDLGGNTEYYNPPEDLEIENLYFSRIITNPTSPDDFLLITLNGDVYKGSIIGGNVDYQKYTETKTYNSTFLTNCLFRAKSTLCFRGESSLAPSADDHSEGGHTPSTEKGTFFEIDFSSDNPSVKNLSSDQDIALDYLLTTGNNLDIGVGSNEMLYVLEKKGDKLIATPFMKNVTSAATTGESIYFASNNRLYRLQNTTTASLVVNTDRVAIKSVFASGGKILLNATLADLGSTLHTYLVSDSVATPEESQFIKTLPLPAQMFSSSRGIGSSDLVGNLLYVQIKLSIYAESLGSLNLNEDIEETKVQVYDLLAEKGIARDKLQIVFGF